METARTEVGFQKMEKYMRQQQNMVAKYIPMPSLIDPCGGSDRALGEHMWVRWWDQVGINIAGAREVKATTAAAEEEGGKE